MRETSSDAAFYEEDGIQRFVALAHTGLDSLNHHNIMRKIFSHAAQYDDLTAWAAYALLRATRYTCIVEQ